MGIDGMFAQEKHIGDLLIGLTFGNKGNDFVLSFGQNHRTTIEIFGVELVEIYIWFLNCF